MKSQKMKRVRPSANWAEDVLKTGIIRVGPNAKMRLTITGEPEQTFSKEFGKDQLKVPTDQGVLFVSSFQIKRPLARRLEERHGKLTGSVLEFRTNRGEGTARRYLEVKVDGRTYA